MDEMELTVSQEQELESLGRQLQVYMTASVTSGLQCGRVLLQARGICPHGQWEGWVRRNGGMSLRSAENLMRAYQRFGDCPALDMGSISNVYAMLSLPEGSEEGFLASHDVAKMTSREVAEAVKAEREKLQKELDEANGRASQLMMQLEELEHRPPVIPKEVAEELLKKNAELERAKEELSGIRESAQEILNERHQVSAAHAEEVNRLRMENENAEKALAEARAMAEDADRECDQMRRKLLEAQRANARGDADRDVSEALTGDDFRMEVNRFMAVVSQIPYMRGAFTRMGAAEVDQFRAGIRTVAQWAEAAEKALQTVGGEYDVR